MPITTEDIARYVNESGFPLQIAVQHAIDASVSRTGWSVRYVEHGWVNPVDGQSGFIDLVAHRVGGRQFFVVECKRVRDVAWVFMHYSGKAVDRLHARPWISHATPTSVLHHGWGNASAEPSCPEATFCTVRGNERTERAPVLERIGSELILATEALAESERDFRHFNAETRRLYFPMIVTTAALKIVDFDPATVSLKDGQLNLQQVRDVPYLRFRKQLATRFTRLGPSDLTDSGDPSYSMESSVFVVQASSVVEFLSQFRASVE